MVADARIRHIILSLAEKIKREYQPDKIILYGSYAYGKPDKDSDIDLLIIKDTPERPIDRMVEIRDIVDIRDPSYPAFFPIVVTSSELKARLERGDQFFEEIISKGRVLYGC